MASIQPHDAYAWYDTTGRDADSLSSILSRISGAPFDAVVLYPANAVELCRMIPARLRCILQLDTLPMFHEALQTACLPSGPHDRWIVSSTSTEVLDAAQARQLACCLRVTVTSGAELHGAIERGRRYPWLLLSLRDVTNIPLELAVATLQGSGTKLIKEISDPDNVDDAIVSLGVMEKGADGVMFSPRAHEPLDRFLERLDEAKLGTMAMSVGTVRRTAPVGMGHRSCVDLITMFGPREGLLVGSTSQGGLLCCPEVFPMPYMDLRPFRVNAGAIHSYIYGLDGKTNYLSELRAGVSAMVVGLDGTTRPSTVGRIKTEIRPLRLIEVEFGEGVWVNLFLQDDWHVRIFSDDGRPICLSDLRAGDRVLGHVASPGRHVGIKITETIVER
jgi:3-dehydroquinate synthase II/3-amino-4-hydroxybenzoic acid synthase